MTQSDNQSSTLQVSSGELRWLKLVYCGNDFSVELCGVLSQMEPQDEGSQVGQALVLAEHIDMICKQGTN